MKLVTKSTVFRMNKVIDPSLNCMLRLIRGLIKIFCNELSFVCALFAPVFIIPG